MRKIMTGIELRSEISEIKSFFQVFEKEIYEQLTIFEAGQARADSAVVSEWIVRVYLSNIQHTIKKLDEFYQLTINEQEEKKEAILNKTEDFLLRAKQALEDSVTTTRASATYIPVPAHKQFATNAQALLAAITSLLSDLRFPHRHTAKKSWYNQSLHKAVEFIQIRTHAFGLGRPTYHEDAAFNLNQLAEKLISDDLGSSSSEATVAVGLATTKTTIRQEAEQHRYLPATLDLCLQQFKALQKSGGALSKQAVMDVMTPEFPNPRAQR
jgi:hypothetical protein